MQKGGSTPRRIFYANDGLVSSTEPEWLQGVFYTLSGMFDRVVLWTDIGKTVGMVCPPCRS